MKKIFATVIAIALVASLPMFAATKKTTTKKSTKATNYSKLVKTQKDPATKKAYDFKGLEVVIYDWWSGDGTPQNKQQEDQAAFRKYLEDTYKFKCSQKNLNAGWSDHPAEVANYCITGGTDARIFIIDSRSALTGAANGLWANVSKVPDIDWTRENGIRLFAAFSLAIHLLQVNQSHVSVFSGTSVSLRKTDMTQTSHTTSRRLENGHGLSSKKCVML